MKPPLPTKILLTAFACLLLSAFILYWRIGPYWPIEIETLIGLGKEYVYWPFLDLFKRTIFTPLFFGGVAAILALERSFPVDANQKPLSSNLAQDFLWLLIDGISQAVLILVYIQWLKHLHQEYFGFLKIGFVEHWPYWTQIIWGLLITDFLFWFHHWLRHKIPWLWHFHTVHHSQTHMNLFSDQRYHILEYFIASTIYIIPLLVMGVTAPQIALIAILQRWHTRLYHSNIKTNFGPLRYIFVTPQSHRVHHSILPEHRDKNFGVTFSIWDQFFGTQYRGWNDYPPTGVSDPLFPNDSVRKGIDFVSNIIAQTLYPFRMVARSIISFVEKI